MHNIQVYIYTAFMFRVYCSIFTVQLVHCSTYTVQRILFSVYCSAYTVQRTLLRENTVYSADCSERTLFKAHTIQSAHYLERTLFRVHTVQSAHCSDHTLFRAYTVQSSHCSKCTLFRANTVQHTLFNVQLFGADYFVHIVQRALLCVHCTTYTVKRNCVKIKLSMKPDAADLVKTKTLIQIKTISHNFKKRK